MVIVSEMSIVVAFMVCSSHSLLGATLPRSPTCVGSLSNLNRVTA